QARTLYQTVIREVLEEITENVLEKYITKEQRKQRATLISASQRLNHALNGLHKYGRIIDSDRVKSFHKRVSIKDLREWREKLIAEPPTVFLFK
ncbi:hypothetical protein HGB07_08135, partial [Candidatus Roizmanbacteria bacterium]|nr:hypothetical protein [Candidatus Roizmanbacteria bacterium]